MADAALALRPLPRLTDVRSLLQLFPDVEDVEDPAAPDCVEGVGKLRYRFFRDAEQAPFLTAGDGFQVLDAWYLADASLLAYAARPLPSPGLAAVRQVEAAVEVEVTPPLRRLFAAVAQRDGPGPDPLQVKAIVRASPLERLAPLVSPVQCLVADDGRMGLVVFRGTLFFSLASWLGDFDVDLAPMPGPDPAAGDAPRVHDGFRRAAELLLSELSEGGEADPGLREHLAARRSARPGLRLWFAGHSLGGALATLCALSLGHVEALYTFGSPRVGEARFAARFAATGIPHHRVVHHHDLVPHLPVPLPPLFPYQHVGTLEQLECVDERHRSLGVVGSALEPLLDHAPLYYSTLLWNEFVIEQARAPGRRDAG